MIDIWQALFTAISRVTSKYDAITASLVSRIQSNANDITILQKRTKQNRQFIERQFTDGRELSQFSWKELSQIARDGTSAEYDIHVGDYKTITVGEYSFKMVIYAIDSYTGAYNDNTKIGHHFDWISEELYPNRYTWKGASNNNGDASDPCPYPVSELFTQLNYSVFPMLPADLKSVIIDKWLMVESRYSPVGKLTSSTNSLWRNVGKLWVPTEYEVTGSIIKGTKPHSAGQSVHYIPFNGNCLKRVKTYGRGGKPESWWLSTVNDGDSVSICIVNTAGAIVSYDASNELAVPICFRIG